MRRIIVSVVGLAFALAMIFSVSDMIGASNPEMVETIILQDKSPALASSMEARKAIYESKGTCYVCHQLTGAGMPPAFHR